MPLKPLIPLAILREGSSDNDEDLSDSYMERNDYLIKKKFYSYLLPGVLMVVAMQLGNVVDGIIVGNILGSTALAAISLSMPVLYALQLPAFILGIGGSARVSYYLGKREIGRASGVFFSCLAVGSLLAIIMCATAPFVSRSLAGLLAGTPELEELLYPYILVNIFGIPFLTLALQLSYFFNVDNNPVLGSAMFIIANIVNLFLDVLLLKLTPLGMYGAALSTVIGYTCGLLLLVPYIRSQKRMLSFERASLADCLQNMPDTIKAGIPSGMFFIMLAVKDLILNTGVVRLLGQGDMEIFSVCTNSVFIAELFVGGVIGLVQTICGILYGERDYYGIRRLVRRVITMCVILTAFLTSIFLLLPQLIAGLFGYGNAALMGTALTCIRVFSLCFIFYAFNKFLQTYYQTILRPLPATIDTVLQNFVILVPVTFLFLHLWGIVGVCAAPVVSEALAVLAVCAFIRVQQMRGRLLQKGLLLLPEKDSESCCDITIRGTEQEAVKASEELIKCCLGCGMDGKNANIIGLAVEEIAVNISRYGYEHKNIRRSYIDINLSQADGRFILRIRDDGVPFDPTQYAPEEEGTFRLGGIGLIKQAATKFSYIRALNMNNTVIELDISSAAPAAAALPE